MNSRQNIVKHLFAMALAAFLLLGPVYAADAEPARAAGKDKTLLDLYHDGGPIMHLIALCSLATVALCGFCALSFSKGKLMPVLLVNQLNALMANRDIPGAFDVCRSQPGVMTRALASALVKANFERDMYNKGAMENAIADECFREETKMMVLINYLNTFAVMAPMIGLLGTVSGMITSFSALTAGKAEASELAGGIGEALVATAGGLLLAIPAMFFYFYFRGQAQSVMADVHKTLSSMLDLFTGEVTVEALRAPTGHTMRVPVMQPPA